MQEQSTHYNRIHNAGIYGQRIWGPLAERVVERAQQGKKISSAAVHATLHTARSRYNFESDSGIFPPQREALLAREAVEVIPGVGDALDVVSTGADVLKGALLRDPVTTIIQGLGALIPILPSDLLPATKAAWEDGIMRALLRRSDARAVNVLRDAEQRNLRRLTSKR